MRPALQRLFDELTEVRIAIAEVEEPARIATNGWTVAQVLDHLAKVHGAIVPRLEAGIAAASVLKGEEDVRYSFLDRRLVDAMSGRIKLPVPPMFRPGGAGPEAKAVCLASIDALLDLVGRADGKALDRVRVPSPINERLRFGLLAYLDATVQHARYHRGQI